MIPRQPPALAVLPVVSLFQGRKKKQLKLSVLAITRNQQFQEQFRAMKRHHPLVTGLHILVVWMLLLIMIAILMIQDCRFQYFNVLHLQKICLKLQLEYQIHHHIMQLHWRIKELSRHWSLVI